MPILGQLRKRLRSLEELIPSIAALVLSLAIDFYPDSLRISQGKNSRFVFNEENGAIFTLEHSFHAEKKIEKTTQNWSVKPSIFDGLKTSRHVVCHESSGLMF